MNQDQLNALFDQQAAGYDAQWAKTQAVRDCLHLLLAETGVKSCIAITAPNPQLRSMAS